MFIKNFSYYRILTDIRYLIYTLHSNGIPKLMQTTNLKIQTLPPQHTQHFPRQNISTTKLTIPIALPHFQLLNHSLARIEQTMREIFVARIAQGGGCQAQLTASRDPHNQPHKMSSHASGTHSTRLSRGRFRSALHCCDAESFPTSGKALRRNFGISKFVGTFSRIVSCNFLSRFRKVEMGIFRSELVSSFFFQAIISCNRLACDELSRSNFMYVYNDNAMGSN